MAKTIDASDILVFSLVVSMTVLVGLGVVPPDRVDLVAAGVFGYVARGMKGPTP